MKQNSVESGFINAGAASWIPPTTTFASAPQSPATGSVYLFTDALTPGANVGGGTSLSTCRWSGTAWVSAGAGPPVTIQDEGVILTSRTILNFVGAGVVATDDVANTRTVVTIAGGFTDPTTTKGDIIARGTAAPATRLAVGTVANQTLLVDSAQTLGIKWATMTAAMVTNAVDQTGSYTNPAWIVSIPWSKVTGAPSVSSYQTPWTQDIDGAGFTLKNAGKIGVGNDAVVVPDADTAVHLIVGSSSSIAQGQVSMCANVTAASAPVGSLNFCNYNLAGADKRIVTITGATDGAPNSGQLIFYTWNAGVFDNRMTISAAGRVGIGSTTPQNTLHVATPNTATPGRFEFVSSLTATFNDCTILLKNASPTVGSGSAIQSMNAGGGVTCELRFINGPGTGVYPNNGGSIAFATYDGAGGAGTERMRIMAAGGIVISSLPATSPGAGSKQLWYDPADGNRVKYAV